jgi:hypothetical protein
MRRNSKLSGHPGGVGARHNSGWIAPMRITTPKIDKKKPKAVELLSSRRMIFKT